MSRPEPPRFSIGITTRNRPDSLRRSVASLAVVSDWVTEIVVVDDASDMPVFEALSTLPPALLSKLTLIRQAGEGYIAARNAIMRRVTADYVLLMDDDAHLVGAEALRAALSLLETHQDVAAIACAQAEADGSPWPAAMQPSPVRYACYVPSFIGFAHVLRRKVFLELGGYRTSFYFYGEEKDYCQRLLNAGHHVVYLPDALVAHLPDPSGRSHARYLRYVIRNDCLCALYNEPLPLPMMTVPIRLGRYLMMRRHRAAGDPGGFTWIVRELISELPSVLHDRKPIRWASIRRWRWLRRSWPAFAPTPTS